MNTPNSGMGNQNLTIENDMLKMLTGQLGIPLKSQVPKAKQFNLGDPYQEEQLNSLLLKAFRKEVAIWMLEKNWTKEGDCVVATFYSEILKTPEVSTGSHTTTHVKMKEDKLFDEFVIYMNDINKEHIEEVEES